MYRFLFLFITLCNVSALEYRGVVTNTNGKPLDGVVVSLIGDTIQVVSGADGSFILRCDVTSVISGKYANSEIVSFFDDKLVLNLASDVSSASVSLLSLQGRVVLSQKYICLEKGVHSFPFSKRGIARGTYLLKMFIDDKMVTRKINYGTGGGATAYWDTASPLRAVFIETLLFNKRGFVSMTVVPECENVGTVAMEKIVTDSIVRDFSGDYQDLK